MNNDNKLEDGQLLLQLDTDPNSHGHRSDFAFGHPSGACRKRVAIVGEVAARGWGIIVPYTVMTALRTASLAIASRALATLVKVGEARRVRIVGTNEYAWGTTGLLARQYPGAKPGTRFFPAKGIEVWKPYVEFVHNQLALRVLCGLSPPKDFLTEPEITRLRAAGDHVSDGLVRLMIHNRWLILELQVEKSRKTGVLGGWARLARRIIAISADQPTGRWRSPLGIVNGVLVVASLADAQRIASRVRELMRGLPLPPVFFFFVEIKANDGAPIDRYEDIHPSSP
ncbi:MAG: hypothetical protein EPN40_13525, partial [Rhodanobacteraceae bacterium]